MQAIDYFNSSHPLRKVASALIVRARESQWRLFEKHFGGLINPKLRVLDLGTTPDETHPDSNFFARRLAGKVDLTLCSIEDCQKIAAKLGARYLSAQELENQAAKKSFDLIVSIAVLEHCGSYEKQRIFAQRIEASGKYFFVTTPYRWFPVEIHTYLPLLHWLPRRWHRKALRSLLGEKFWSLEENLNLLGRREAARLFSTPRKEMLHTFTKTLVLPSNQIFIRSPRTLREEIENP